MLLVSAANVGEHLHIGPTWVDCGATAVYASSEGACCSVQCWSVSLVLPSSARLTRLDCRRGVLANARYTAGQRLVGRLSVPS